LESALVVIQRIQDPCPRALEKGANERRFVVGRQSSPRLVYVDINDAVLLAVYIKRFSAEELSLLPDQYASALRDREHSGP
jgi:hypothetical protein